MTLPTLGQMLLGTEGLALLRQAFVAAPAARESRLAEMRLLLARYDAELAQPLDAVEYGRDAGYAQWAHTYDAPLRLFPIETPSVQALLASLPPGCRVLDAACGTGRHSAWLAERGLEVIGIDASPAMLARARAKVPSGWFELGDLATLPLADASVDAALCALALVHLPDLRPVMAELARVVRPGGRIVVSDVHPFLVQLGWQAQFLMADGRAGLIRLHPHLPSDYAAAAVAAGLTIGSLHEPLLTATAARTVAEQPIPDANTAAWAGLPGVIVWELLKPAPA